ncbi:Hypothetical protein, putative [Bodo saltans]|uniref:CCHC-type domain-containing protein n=1 Tax=Bodo saltans TaxID=75058 RepID=A0A0S4INF3_BODSA|nr:Hypothetical protein, putative [Bodo saltans]|eukprot:CUF65687.1 Hypothetical protein, putative [Bodo saltans]
MHQPKQQQQQQQPLKWSDLQAVFASQDDDDDGDAPSTPFCFNCREDGHAVAHCPHPKRCYICLKPTHQGYQCAENPVPGSIAFKHDTRCEYCHEKGHSAIFCRKPGGAAHGRKADTVFARPLVLHAPRDGPNEADVKKARIQITEILRRLQSASIPNCNVGTVLRLDLGKMRDSEFFCAVLPLLNDPTASGMPTNDRNTIRQCLYKMRGAVAGGIQLGVTRGGDGPTKKSHKSTPLDLGNNNAAGTDDRDLLYDMKTSGLDINILHSGRLDVFHRTRAAGVRGGTMEIKSNDDTQLLHPEGVISDTVYLASQHRGSPGRSGGGGGGGVHNGKTASPTKGALPNQSVRPVDRLVTNLEQMFARKQLLMNAASQRKGPQAQIIISPTRASPSRRQPGGGGSSTTSADGRSRSGDKSNNTPSSKRFIAPVPPHTRQKGDVAQEVLHRWAIDGPASTPRPQELSNETSKVSQQEIGGPVVPSQLRAGGPSVVRSFLNNATHQFGDPQRRWSQTGGHNARHSHQEGTSSQQPIMNWDRYRKQNPSLADTKPRAGGTSISHSSNRPHSATTARVVDTSVVVAPVQQDLVAKWRERFDYSKTTSSESVEQMLAERAMHRRMVAGDGTRYESLATALVQQATRPGTAGTPSTGGTAARAGAAAAHRRRSSHGITPDGSSTHVDNLWTVHCGVLANDEAEATLRRAVVDEVTSYAKRIAFYQDEGHGHSGISTTFLSELERLVFTVETPEEFKQCAEKLVHSYGVKFRSGRAMLIRLVGIAATLFQEMQVAQHYHDGTVITNNASQ